MALKGWIGFDLDGTLAWYDSWRGPDHIGEPIRPVVDLAKKLLEEGEDVRIFTARVCSTQPEGLAETARTAIQEWSEKHLGQVVPVTAEKDYTMAQLYDDRCVQLLTNTGVRADGRKLDA